MSWLLLILFHTLSNSLLTIQGDSGGEVNILGGDIGYCEKKSSYEHVSNSGWLQR